ncbi:MAG: tRNA pseudouridine(55) synthase TruB [Bacteroidales bacterium]|nr:tRNA pseudouridine(55) synthase TruB [Bacteroidales bacterium]
MLDLKEGGFFLINKPYTWTSFQVVKKMKYILTKHFSEKKFKIGHAGTLDPLATGLLIICVGKYTKKIEEFQGLRKEYTGTFRLGATTLSYDREHAENQTFPISHINETLLRQTAKAFIGPQKQVPPVYSALRIDGKRAYSYAKQGLEPEMKEKDIEIYDFDITEVNMPEAAFRIACSKGTYIRSVARDFGLELNSGAYLSSLCRTKIGDYCLQDALSLEDFEEMFPHKKD